MTEPQSIPTEAEIAEIRARLEHITSGPWVATTTDDGYLVVQPDDSSGWQVAGFGDMEEVGQTEYADAMFCAHARTNIPRLLAALDAAQAELNSLKARHRDLGRYAVHLGNCKFLQDPDVCTCGLAAHSEVLEDE